MAGDRKDPTLDYLGDGVYARFDGHQVWVWTSNGVENSPKIAIAAGVLSALNRYNTRMRSRTDEE